MKRRHTEDGKTAESKKPRFQIEKLEERIAPAKGGIAGLPDHSNGNGNGPDCSGNPKRNRC